VDGDADAAGEVLPVAAGVSGVRAAVGEPPGRVAVAVARMAGVAVAIVRPGSALLLLSGGEMTRKTVTSVPTMRARIEPR